MARHIISIRPVYRSDVEAIRSDEEKPALDILYGPWRPGTDTRLSE